MGSLFGARLAEAGQNVALVDVKKAHIEAIRTDGLGFEDEAGFRRVKINATLDAGSVGLVDLIILFCKYPHTRAAIAASRPMIGPDTYVWTLQNGIGNIDIIAENCPRNRISKGLTSVTAIIKAPGHVLTNFQGESETFAWPLDGGHHPKLEQATKILSTAGLPAYLAPDIDYRIWRKLVVNASLTVVSAATNLGIGAVGESEPGQRLLRAVIGEVVQVAQANGVALQLDDAIAYMEELRRKAFDHVGSTTVDLQNRRPTEIDAMSGAVVREGQRVGIPTPVNQTMAELVRLIEATQSLRLSPPI